MAGPITVEDGSTVTQAPGDKRVYQFDYDAENLAVGVSLTSYGTFTITALKPSTATGLTKDNESLVSGSRITQLRLITDSSTGALYRIDNHVTTNESPAQEKTKHFVLKVER